MCKLGTGLESEGNAVTFINYRLEYVPGSREHKMKLIFVTLIIATTV